jgi:uncharacterized membrane protein YraQ (UPF0718 family)
MTGAALLLAELVVLFFLVTFAIQLFQRRVGDARLRAWMGGAPPVAALKGIAIGFVTPFCTYSAIPLLVGFRQAGVAPAGYVAFIMAAPVLDPILFGALILIVGLAAATTYLAVAFVAAMTLALLAQRLDITRWLKPLPASLAIAPVGVEACDTSCSPVPALAATPAVATTEALATIAPHASSQAAPPVSHTSLATPVALEDSDAIETCGTDRAPAADAFIDACDTTEACATDTTPWRGWTAEAPAAARSATALLRTMAPLLLLGVAIGLAITTLVPTSTAVRITSVSDALAIPAAAALGTPLYINTGLFVPIADALGAAGVGTGAVIALTIAGAGANLPEFVILGRLARLRLVAGLFAYVFLIAIAGGLLAEAITA